MSCFFLPIVFGCPTMISVDSDKGPRVCPRCHNPSVFEGKSRMWFELCFIPLIPMTSNRVWHCNICSWSVQLQPGWEPPVPGATFPSGYYPVYSSPGANNALPPISPYTSPPPPPPTFTKPER